MKFTYKAYVDLLNHIKKLGYSFIFYNEISKYDKALILRHDVDFDLDKAVYMAEKEYQMGVKSTFFILLTTDLYNVLSLEGSRKVNRIIEMGHRIGLHFDEQRYDFESVEEFKKKIYFEVGILEKTFDIEVDSFSMHRPSPMILKKNVMFDELINTYSSDFFTEILYVSDSRFKWKQDIYEVLANKDTRKIQLLIHPFSYDRNEYTVRNKLLRFIHRASLDRYCAIDSNFRDLQEFVNKDDLL